MAFLTIDPAQRDLCRRHGLDSVRAFLKMEGVIWGGHPGRLVMRARLGDVPVFLKKEFTTPWRTRLMNVWAGFGWTALATREALLLKRLRQRNIACPDVIAHGEVKGQAFLLIREASGVELRVSLEQAGPAQRRRLARQLGVTVAALHEAGISHPDLLAKHVLVHEDGSVVFLDWQRAPTPHALSKRERTQNLAMLDASLSEQLASVRDRLAFFRSYWRHASLRSLTLVARRDFWKQILRQSAKMQRRRRMRELRGPTLPAGQQNLIWLDGERLCVTRQFRDDCRQRLAFDPWSLHVDARAPRRETTIALANGRRLTFLRTWTRTPWRWLWRRCRGRGLVAPGFDQAAALFRLERHGIRLPKLLAVGQHFLDRWTMTSFLLIEPHANVVALTTAWKEQSQRRSLLTEAGALLRRIHEAGYRVNGFDAWAVIPGSNEIVLQSVEHLSKGTIGQARDLVRLARALHLDRHDAAWLGRAYGVRPRRRAWGKARRLLRWLTSARPRRAPA